MNIAYLNFKDYGDFLMAGILVVDEKTKPLEFRITSKLSIDELQKIIYGETFKEIVFVEKLALELINSTDVNIDFILLNEKKLLTLRKKLNYPVFYLEKFDEFKPRSKYSVNIQSLSGKYDTLNLIFSPEDEQKINQIAKILTEMYKNLNIIEPFSRIVKAIDYLESQGIND